MSLDNFLLFFHFLSMFIYVAGLAAVMSSLLQAWGSKDVRFQVSSFEAAHTAEQALLMPGAVFTGITGLLVGAEGDYNLITTGWLVALEVIFLIVLLFCIPVLALGLGRVHLLSVQAARDSSATPKLEEALADNVPLVFGVIVIVLTIVMAYLAVFRPF